MPDDLDEFLKRAAEKRKRRKPEIVLLDDQPGPAGRPSVTAPPPPIQRPSPPARPQSPSKGPPASSTTPVAQPARQPLSHEEPLELHKSVEEHVQHHLDTRDFQERATKLGAEVDLADDKLEAHLHQVFDHDVGTLSHGRRRAAEGETTPSASFFQAMFQSMDELRRAIILREILERPKF